MLSFKSSAVSHVGEGARGPGLRVCLQYLRVLDMYYR
jgi:hypothetical protein